MRQGSRLAAAATCAAAAAAVAIPVSGSAHSHQRFGEEHGHHGRAVKHVLLISVDGLHQSDLKWYVRTHPSSELARLAGGGAEYAHARTPVPSDSFPGMVGQVTGGNPATTGVYTTPATTTICSRRGRRLVRRMRRAARPSTTTSRSMTTRVRSTPARACPDCRARSCGLTSDPRTLINPAALPVDPQTCKPVYPSDYLKVNTIFEVARRHGLRTAWSDKHPAYEILDGPSGQGVQDFFTPEINSDAIGLPSGDDWTSDNAATMQYDSYKVQAVINEIDGYDHSRTTRIGVPAIFGMNFQTVSTAQKLPSSDGLTGGYLPGTRTPGPLLSRALDYINSKLAAMDAELRAQHIADSTAIIVSAKHGQSPQDPNALTRIDDGPIVNAINSAWAAQHPGAGDLIVGGTNDDAFQAYLSDRSQGAADFVKTYLLTHTATGNTVDGSVRTLQHSGLVTVFAGDAAARYFHVRPSDPRHPDVWGIVQHGVVFTGGKGKIAEHGGANIEDRHVPIIVYAPGLVRPRVVDDRVETTQIAPTILRFLGLDPAALEAVRIEGTAVLPGR